MLLHLLLLCCRRSCGRGLLLLPYLLWWRTFAKTYNKWNVRSRLVAAYPLLLAHHRNQLRPLQLHRLQHLHQQQLLHLCNPQLKDHALRMSL